MSMKFNWLQHKDVLKEMIELRKKGMTYANIQTYLEDVHGVYATTDMIRSAYNRHARYYPGTNDDVVKKTKMPFRFKSDEDKKSKKQSSFMQKAVEELSERTMSKRDQKLGLMILLLLLIDDKNE